MNKNVLFITGILLSMAGIIPTKVPAQFTYADNNHKITFPDLPGYLTLACDFHQHTAFSDGSVWPEIRIGEALIEGLGAIAITDHLEYLPHDTDVPNPDKNRVYQLTREAARGQELLVISGAEITRNMPPGHANAIFLKDANRLVGIDSFAVFREAARQGAFVIWNHPHWHAQNPKGTAELTDMHRQLLEEGLIGGIEVVNEHTWSDEALQIALDFNLAIMGASDIHDLIEWQYRVQEGGHRPVTLVFANDKTEESLKEALKNRRTVVWSENTLIGRPEYLVPLIGESLRVKSSRYLDSYSGGSSIAAVDIMNSSDATYVLENTGNYTFYNNAGLVTLKPHGITSIMVKLPATAVSFDLSFRVLNAVTAPATHPEIGIHVEMPKP